MTVTAELETPPPVALTDKQRAVYDWIVQFCETHGYSPTVREVSAAFGVNINATLGHLKALAKKGWITKHTNRSRTIRPIGGLK